jgi:hypothetical protein
MTALLFVLAFLLLFALWAVGMGLARLARNRDRRQLQVAERRATKAEARAKQAERRVAEKDEHLRDWAAHVDDLLAEQERHQARCPWAQAEPETARWS